MNQSVIPRTLFAKRIAAAAAIGWICPIIVLLDVALEKRGTAIGDVALWGLALSAVVQIAMLVFISTLLRPVGQVMRTLRELAGPLEGQLLTDDPPVFRIDQISTRLNELRERWTRRHGVTDMPTRETLAERIAEDIAAGVSEAMLGTIRFLDYHRLAEFDELSADETLRVFAQRLLSAAPPHHVVSHVDRDCFAIWFCGDQPLAQWEAELQALAYALQQELSVGDRLIRPAVEAGWAVFPADGANAATLLTRAIAAIDIDRPGSPDAPARFSIEAVSVARERFELQQAMMQALDGDELELYYQPVVDLAMGRPIGAEALLRWHHPEEGLVMPVRFMPIVETCDLADRIGLWTLNTACRDAASWRTPTLSNARVAVNLSAHQLRNPALADSVIRTLQMHALDPSRLELELTETAAMEDAERTRIVFDVLRAHGVTLAIDDFGSGYSSLSYVKNLPFDKLKIDREFVQDVDKRADSQAICRALLALGKGLGIRVLAEGVETEAEVRALFAMGCALFQGYYFGHPQPLDGFLASIEDQAWRERLLPAVARQHAVLQRKLGGK